MFTLRRFLSKRYSGEDSVEGSFSQKWDEWFENDRFSEIQQKTDFYEDGDTCIGLCRIPADGTFEYWIGVFAPAGSQVPDGYLFLDFEAAEVAVCWEKGKEPDIYMTSLSDYTDKRMTFGEQPEYESTRRRYMKKLTADIEKIIIDRFSKDTLIALATAENNMPSVRTVDAYYENRSFYVLTYALSNKMKQIKANPNVAISGEWFTAKGEGVNLGYFCKEENEEIANRMKTLFSAWIDNGHNDFSDENTVILQIRLKEGTLVADNKWMEIDFTE